MTRIVVVEDHPSFAKALAHMLQRRGEHQVEIIPTGEEALEFLQDCSPDLVLIDISLPGRNGLWLVEALHQMQPGLPCLMLSGHDNRRYVDQAMQAGARGYVLKEDLPGLLDGIRAALTGGTYISESLRPR